MPLRQCPDSWRFTAAAPAREIFAVMEQAVGTPPYRFQVTGHDQATALEVERRSILGGVWTRRIRHPRWVRCTAGPGVAGTTVLVEASRGRSPRSRALQLVALLSRGNRDRRTIYRERFIPPGPVSLVASWAGMGYAIFTEPRLDAPRAEVIHTASAVEAIRDAGAFVLVRLSGGAEGYVEKDQIVPAPAESTREAQPRAAVLG